MNLENEGGRIQQMAENTISNTLNSQCTPSAHTVTTGGRSADVDSWEQPRAHLSGLGRGCSSRRLTAKLKTAMTTGPGAPQTSKLAEGVFYHRNRSKPRTSAGHSNLQVHHLNRASAPQHCEVRLSPVPSSVRFCPSLSI
ncbi:rCG41382 [Rattus norvegicus]|uniref:RCG41382 n=1 Tax=Rattus norvegicus TaxID=10116 RepID=A6II21_RAT|nr:rCG41382 [Rattus norvegicus]